MKHPLNIAPAKSQRPLFTHCTLRQSGPDTVEARSTDGMIHTAWTIPGSIAGCPTEGIIIPARQVPASLDGAIYDASGTPPMLAVRGSAIPALLGEVWPDEAPGAKGWRTLGPVAPDRVRIGSACMDAERSSPVLTGCMIAWHASGCTVASMDGKALVEAGPAFDNRAEHESIVIPAAVARLMAKAGPDWTVERCHNTIRATRPDGSRIVSRIIEGTFPAYRAALDYDAAEGIGGDWRHLSRLVLAAAEGMAKTMHTQGIVIHSDGAAPLLALKGGRALRFPVPMPAGAPLGVDAHKARALASVLPDGQWTFGRGFRVWADGARGLVMPILLPQDTRLPSDAAPWSPDDSKAKPGKAKPVPAPVAPDMSAEVASLRAEIASLRAALAEAQARLSSCQSAAPAVSVWRPTHQGKQLAAAGIDLGALKAAGFRWVPSVRAWESHTAEGAAMLPRLEASHA